jgi:MoaA/NifB/PqqE/SkfB family radical SAM enzyme
MTPTPGDRATPTPTRTFATAVHDRIRLVYDPLTGLTHRVDNKDIALRIGVDSLNPDDVTTWPVVHPGEVRRGMPISLCWSPLVRCNLDCPHCLDDKAVPELARDGRRRVARILADARLLGVDISGGEPLLLRELPELIDILGAGGCAVSITTNGTHLARRADALAGRVDAIRVSLDGPDRQHHDRWRGAGSFERAVSGIRACVAHAIPTQIQAVLMRSTAHTAHAMVELAGRLGVRGVTFLQMLPIGEGAGLADAEELSDTEARDLVADLPASTEVSVRLRTRDAAGGFTVVRADGQVWRNQPGARRISPLRPLQAVEDLAVTERDGAA